MLSLTLWLWSSLIFILLPTVYALNIPLVYVKYTDYPACGFTATITHTVNSLNELSVLARDAHRAMAIAQATHFVHQPDNVPAAMSALSYHDKIYFHSSIKTCHQVKTEGWALEAVMNTLFNECQREFSTLDHRANYRCAEVLASNLLVHDKRISTIETFIKMEPKLISTVGATKDAIKSWGSMVSKTHVPELAIEVWNPCGIKNGKWGCDIVLTRLGFRQGNIAPQGAIPHNHRRRGQRLEKNA